MASVTVLIPARNAEKTLGETFDSFVTQTFRDFDILLVNDASSDATVTIAESYSGRLDIAVLPSAGNLGVAGALNFGLMHINSPYIARIDADDLAMPTRLEKQFNFLESHSSIDVISTAMEVFYDNGNPSHLLTKPEGDAAIKTSLLQFCSMSHGASMFRKSFFDDVGIFDLRYDYAEDYDLWCRGALLGKHYANLSEPLSRYRQHGNQVSKQKRMLQYERDLAIKRKYISALLGGRPSGYLAEFFSGSTVFPNKDIAFSVLEQSMPLLFKLSGRVADEKVYADIVSECIGRILRI